MVAGCFHQLSKNDVSSNNSTEGGGVVEQLSMGLCFQGAKCGVGRAAAPRALREGGAGCAPREPGGRGHGLQAVLSRLWEQMATDLMITDATASTPRASGSRGNLLLTTHMGRYSQQTSGDVLLSLRGPGLQNRDFPDGPQTTGNSRRD